jgi:biopolymer transport protein TolQ
LIVILGHAPLLQVNFWELVKPNDVTTALVLLLLLFASLLSWTIILSKLFGFHRMQRENKQFLREFRKAGRMDLAATAADKHRGAPLVGVFDFGYSEVSRQWNSRHAIINKGAVERTLQLGSSEEIARLEHNLHWLATIASVSPFIGLFGTVLGIVDAFQALGLTGATSMRTVGPGIARALVATAVGLGAAIPAAVAYNHFGSVIKEIGQRMDDFSLEFLNLTERNYEE